MKNAPTFIRELVEAGVAAVVDREDSVVNIELFCHKNKLEDAKFSERMGIQLWFDERGFSCNLENIDSKGDPHYIALFSGNDQSSFQTWLLKFARQQGNSSQAFAKMVQILSDPRQSNEE